MIWGLHGTWEALVGCKILLQGVGDNFHARPAHFREIICLRTFVQLGIWCNLAACCNLDTKSTGFHSPAFKRTPSTVAIDEPCEAQATRDPKRPLQIITAKHTDSNISNIPPAFNMRIYGYMGIYAFGMVSNSMVLLEMIFIGFVSN